MATTMKKCACGCGTLVRRDYAQGHDAIHKSHLMYKLREGRTKQERQKARRVLTSKGWAA